MNIQEDEKKPVYEILDTVTITKQHFNWLNWEVLRIGQEARKYADERDLLKAEIERLTNNCNYLDQKLDEELDKSAMLCGQVERLTFDPLTYLDDQGEWMPRHTHLAAVERLKAEVERLTKAGDAMASSIQFNEEMAQDYNGPTIVHQSVQRWNAAKEGKQSQ